MTHPVEVTSTPTPPALGLTLFPLLIIFLLKNVLTFLIKTMNFQSSLNFSTFSFIINVSNSLKYVVGEVYRSFVYLDHVHVPLPSPIPLPSFKKPGYATVSYVKTL